jgi:hypothetical protein
MHRQDLSNSEPMYMQELVRSLNNGLDAARNSVVRSQLGDDRVRRVNDMFWNEAVLALQRTALPKKTSRSSLHPDLTLKVVSHTLCYHDIHYDTGHLTVTVFLCFVGGTSCIS